MSKADDAPLLDDVLEFPAEQRTDDRRWIVLYEEDYDNVALDTEGNVALLVDIEQTGELIRLAAESLAALSHRDATDDDVLEDLIAQLEKEVA